MWIVFDASTKCGNISLKGILLSEIDYLNNLVGAIRIFRCGLYATMGDIEKMFLQVKEKEEYLDEHGFTWRDEGQEYIPDNTILSNIFQKKTLCTLLVCVLKQSVKNETNIIQQIVNEKLQVDGFLNSLSKEKDPITNTSKIILSTHGFRLTKFVFYAKFNKKLKIITMV